jgi:outer membrane protein, heavy metal efflux system
MQTLCRTAILALLAAAISSPGSAQEWTEARIIQKFLDQSPQAREARAQVAITEAETRGRGLYPNPRVNYTYEGAGRTEFYQAEQILPITGRLQFVRQGGAASVRATEAEAAFFLWQVRSNLRQAFYRVLAAEQAESLYTVGLTDIEKIIRVLEDRERLGEGSKFDRIRAQRERDEVRAELALLRASTALERSRLLAFLPDDTNIVALSGRMETPDLPLNAEEFVRRALSLRQDYRAEQQRLEQYRFEKRAAERLRLPEPSLNAGLKRADTGRPGLANGPVLFVTVPLPLFNRGQTEVSRYAAEQERVSARLVLLARQIRASVNGTLQAFTLRHRARDEYRRQLAEGSELVRIAVAAYEEGELGILQLLDAFRLQRQAQLRMLEIEAAVKEAQIELERVLGEELGR